MSKNDGILSAIAGILLKAAGSRRASRTIGPGRPDSRLRASQARLAPAAAGTESRQLRGTETLRIDPDQVVELQIAYSPQLDGAPDAGEIVWTWVPYEENDGRGKDRPVLVFGRESAERVYAVRMTSTQHDGDLDYLSIGTGDWDSQGRESWVDLEQLYSVHERGLRREAAVLARHRYNRVGAALMRRYGWSAAG